MTRPSLPNPLEPVGHRHDGRLIYPILGAAPEDDSKNPGDEGSPASGSVKQEDLSRLLAREKTQGGRAAVKKLLGDLGFDNAEALSEFITTKRDADQAAVTEVERREQAADEKLKAAAARARRRQGARCYGPCRSSSSPTRTRRTTGTTSSTSPRSPHGDYPLVGVGRMTLHTNPEDYFIHVEQAAFVRPLRPRARDRPAPPPDKMLQARLFSYADTHRYRIGVNYTELPPSRPPQRWAPTPRTARCVTNVARPCAPNSYGGPSVDEEKFNHPAGSTAETAEMVRAAYNLHSADDDFTQAGNMVRKVLDDDARERPVGNVTRHLLNGVSRPVLDARSIAGGTSTAPPATKSPRGVNVTGRPRTHHPTPPRPTTKVGAEG